MENERKEPKTEAEKAGIDETVKRTFEGIDASDLSFADKRNMLFSLYSFRCLFDNAEMKYVNPVLKKYGCTFTLPLEQHPFYAQHTAEFLEIARNKTFVIPYGGLYVADNGGYTVRFDAGSPVYDALIRQGTLTKAESPVPEKLDLYELVYRIIRLNTATSELKALWYLMFPYIMLLGAPHNAALYETLLDALSDEEIFNKALYCPYSIFVRDSVNELEAAEDIPSTVTDWYAPYITWKNGRDENGVSREEKRFQAWLSAGRFTEVYSGTEKLLDSFPDDDGILICNLAARISLDSVIEKSARGALLKETLALAESALERGSSKKIFLQYYAGLAHLGLGNREAAFSNFAACLDQNPGFSPAQIMVKALKTTAPEGS